MKKTQLALRMPQELKEILKVEADNRGLTLTGLILNILWKYVEKKGENNVSND